MNLIIDIIEQIMGQNPSEAALCTGMEMVSYRSLKTRLNELCYQLRDAGVRRGGHVAICVEKPIDAIISMLAVIKIGGVFSPLDMRGKQIQHIDLILSYMLPVCVVLSKKSSLCQEYNNYTKVILCDAQKPSDFKYTNDARRFITAHNNSIISRYYFVQNNNIEFFEYEYMPLLKHLLWIIEQFDTNGGTEHYLLQSFEQTEALTQILTPLMTGGRLRIT